MDENELEKKIREVLSEHDTIHVQVNRLKELAETYAYEQLKPLQEALDRLSDAARDQDDFWFVQSRYLPVAGRKADP